MRLALAIAASSTAAAAASPPITLLGFPGAASLASGQSHAEPDEGGLYLNPALIAATRRFAIEVDGLLGDSAKSLSAHAYQVASVDDQTGSFALGLGYAHQQSANLRGSVTSIAAGARLPASVQAGAAVHWVDAHGRIGVNQLVLDLGIAWQPLSWLMFGGALLRLNAPDDAAGMPRSYAAGGAAGPAWLRLFGDVTVREPRAGDLQTVASAGLRFSPCGALSISSSFAAGADGDLVAAGAGLRFQRQLVELAYRTATSGARAESFMVGWKIFVTER